MVFKIGDIDVGKLILPPHITDVYRSQSVNYTLNGSCIIDRISAVAKKQIAVQIPLIDSTKWSEIKAVVAEISFAVMIDETAYTVRLDGDIPTPVLYTTEDGYVCSDISLSFEEV